MANLLNVWTKIIQTGGASYNMVTGEFQPSTGYMVSLPGYEKTLPFPQSLNEFTDMIGGLLSPEVWNVLKINSHNHYIGFWVDENDPAKLVFDISENISSFETAMILGKERKQTAIYSCVDGQVIYMNKN